MMLQIYLHYTFIVIYTCLIEWNRDRHAPLSGLFIHSCLIKAKNLQTSHMNIGIAYFRPSFFRTTFMFCAMCSELVANLSIR